MCKRVMQNARKIQAQREDALDGSRRNTRVEEVTDETGRAKKKRDIPLRADARLGLDDGLEEPDRHVARDLQ